MITACGRFIEVDLAVRKGFLLAAQQPVPNLPDLFSVVRSPLDLWMTLESTSCVWLADLYWRGRAMEAYLCPAASDSCFKKGSCIHQVLLPHTHTHTYIIYIYYITTLILRYFCPIWCYWFINSPCHKYWTDFLPFSLHTVTLEHIATS